MPPSRERYTRKMFQTTNADEHVPKGFRTISFCLPTMSVARRVSLRNATDMMALARGGESDFRFIIKIL
jgi:hypothetical protein